MCKLEIKSGSNFNNIKIVFFDVDGTLIDIGAKKVSEKTIEGLKRLKERGIKICLATGRAPIELPNIPNIKFDAYITFNGSYCFDDKNLIYSCPMDKQDVYQIIDNANKLNKSVSIATKDKILCNENDLILEKYIGFAGMKLKTSNKFSQIIKEEDIYQIMLPCEEKEYKSVLSGTKNASIAAWWDKAVDIIPSNSGKGNAVKNVLKCFDIKQNEAMAFGDGDNDIEMLKEVAYGIAMGNSCENLKELANDICKKASEDGVYYYLFENGVI